MIYRKTSLILAICAAIVLGAAIVAVSIDRSHQKASADSLQLLSNANSANANLTAGDLASNAASNHVAFYLKQMLGANSNLDVSGGVCPITTDGWSKITKQVTDSLTADQRSALNNESLYIDFGLYKSDKSFYLFKGYSHVVGDLSGKGQVYGLSNSVYYVDPTSTTFQADNNLVQSAKYTTYCIGSNTLKL